MPKNQSPETKPLIDQNKIEQTLSENMASLRIRSPETNSDADSDTFVWRTLRVRAAQGHFVTDSKLSATSFDKDDLSSCKINCLLFQRTE